MGQSFKINFVVFSQFPQYEDHIGASNVSHTLAKELALLGENTFIYADSTPHKNVTCIPWGTEINYDNENTIFILPAGAGEHTFTSYIPNFIHRSKNTVRHLVNYQTKLYPEEERLYKLSPYFETLNKQKVDGYLPILTVDFDLFKNYNLPRSGRCFLIKGNEYIENQPLFHTASDTNIDHYYQYGRDKFKYLVEMFNKHEVFFTYNTQTFISNLAALCGCRSVIIPHPKTSKEKIYKFPQNKYGIAYGFEDIQHSVDTLPLVKKHLESILVDHKKNLKEFVEDCYSWLGTKYNLL
jgi:hypothetical protein